MKNRGFVPIAVVFIVIAILTIGGYAFYMKQKTTIPVALQTENPVVNQETNKMPAQTSTTSNPDIDRVKLILEEMKQGYLTGNQVLILKHASIETAKFLSINPSSKVDPASSFTVNSFSQSGLNILTNITIIGGQYGADTPQNMVFIKEGGDWKFDASATYKHADGN